MPTMGGLDLGRALKEASQDGSPLVLLTSSGWRPGAQDQSFAAFDSKPVKSQVLRDSLIAVLSGRSVGTLLEQQQSPSSEDQIPQLRILLAEDNLINQRVAQLMLNQLGQSVDIVGNGSAAVDAVRENAYDVVLMDIQMPMMDGLEATRPTDIWLREPDWSPA